MTSTLVHVYGIMTAIRRGPEHAELSAPVVKSMSSPYDAPRISAFFPVQAFSRNSNMADNEEYEGGGGDDGGYLEEANVDESQLKLPQFTWAEGQEVKSGEEEEETLYKT